MRPPLAWWFEDVGGPAGLSSPAVVDALPSSGAEAPVLSFLHHAGRLVCRQGKVLQGPLGLRCIDAFAAPPAISPCHSICFECGTACLSIPRGTNLHKAKLAA